MSKVKTYYVQNKQDGHILQTENPSDWEPNYIQLSTKEGVILYKEQCKAKLRKMLPEGAKVYTILHGVSRSGMSRQIQCVIVNNGDIDDITYLVSQVTGYTQNKAGYLTVGDCDMDMGFAVVYNICMALYGDSYAISHSWL